MQVKPTVLIVDDSEQKRYMLSRYLKAAGFEIWETNSGEEALLLAQKQPSVIALDVNLPDILGYEVSRRLRSDPKTASIPIVQISATFTTSDRKALGLNAGADSYLTGPVEPEELIATVNAMIRMRKAEITAKDLAAKWQVTFDAINDAILLVHYDGTIERCNRAFCQTAEKPLEDVVGRNISDVSSTTTWAEVYFRMCGSHRRESVQSHINGRWLSVTADPVMDSEGSFRGAVLIISDFTESRRTEDLSRRLAAIVESSNDAIISKDLDDIIASWNLSAERMFGYRAEEVIGKHVSLLLPPDRLHEESEIMAHLRKGERVEHYETLRRRKDGRDIEVSLTISPMVDPDGKLLGASKILRDITHQKQAERKLEIAHREAVAASHAKDSFLAALSHELRTPLNPVLLAASAAAEDPSFSADVRAQFKTIQTNVELEARLIDDLLDVTRISHGKLSLNPEQIHVHGVLRDAIDIIRAEITSKRIELTITLDAEQDATRGDAVRLQQVFWNVLSNAVKFTPQEGKISVRTENVSPQEIRISIADTGIGMTANEVERVFEAFTQGGQMSSGEPRTFGGLGLGLAISRKLVEMHSGSITATSEGKNRGSTFHIQLPVDVVKVREQSQDGGGPSSQVSGASTSRVVPLGILLVEDHEATRVTLTALLTRRGHHVKAAISIAGAVALFDPQSTQLLISDISLADGNGSDLMKQLRLQSPKLQGIALTGFGMEQDVERSRAAGFAIHLTKPIRIQTLEAALASLASRIHPPETEHRPREKPVRSHG